MSSIRIPPNLDRTNKSQTAVIMKSCDVSRIQEVHDNTVIEFSFYLSQTVQVTDLGIKFNIKNTVYQIAIRINPENIPQ